MFEDSNEVNDVGPQNEAYITLISIVKKPKSMAKFWPIYLCNVRYKIISKATVH